MVTPEKVGRKIESETNAAIAWFKVLWFPVLCCVGVGLVLYWAVT